MAEADRVHPGYQIGEAVGAVEVSVTDFVRVGLEVSLRAGVAGLVFEQLEDRP
jgi:hypothetical protein